MNLDLYNCNRSVHCCVCERTMYLLYEYTTYMTGSLSSRASWPRAVWAQSDIFSFFFTGPSPSVSWDFTFGFGLGLGFILGLSSSTSIASSALSFDFAGAAFDLDDDFLGLSSSSLLPTSLVLAAFLVSFFFVLVPLASSRSPLASDAVTPASEASESLSVGEP